MQPAPLVSLGFASPTPSPIQAAVKTSPFRSRSSITSRSLSKGHALFVSCFDSSRVLSPARFDGTRTANKVEQRSPAAGCCLARGARTCVDRASQKAPARRAVKTGRPIDPTVVHGDGGASIGRRREKGRRHASSAGRDFSPAPVAAATSTQPTTRSAGNGPREREREREGRDAHNNETLGRGERRDADNAAGRVSRFVAHREQNGDRRELEFHESERKPRREHGEHQKPHRIGGGGRVASDPPLAHLYLFLSHLSLSLAVPVSRPVRLCCATGNGRQEERKRIF